MENLLKLLSLSPDEMNYFVGMVVGTADAKPDTPIGEVVAQAFSEVEAIRTGQVDPFAEVLEALFGPAPTPAPEQDAPSA